MTNEGSAGIIGTDMLSNGTVGVQEPCPGPIPPEPPVSPPPPKQTKRLQLNFCHQRWNYQVEVLARTRDISSYQLIYDTFHRAFGIRPPQASEIGRPPTPPSEELVKEARILIKSGLSLQKTARRLGTTMYLLKKALSE